MGKFLVQCRNMTVPGSSAKIRGQDILLYWVDDHGKKHTIKNCKSLTFTASGRQDLCELTLVLRGELGIDIAVEAAATIIREDDPDA